MPQLKEDAIGPADLLEYLSSYSDFSFELQTLKLLRARGLECEHGGLYEDPVTKKSRQFDIRAIARAGDYCVRLAIECKNIRENFPLLVSCVPRDLEESFHEIAVVGEIEEGRKANEPFESRAHVARVAKSNSLYKPLSPVGKSLAQVGRAKDGIYATDSDVFNKWAQCLTSADDLVSASYWEGRENSPSISYVAVIPMLVIPDPQLWMVQYDADGIRGELVRTDRCSLFVNHAYLMRSPYGPNFRLSHIEIVTSAGLAAFVTDYLQDVDAMQTIFPPDVIDDGIQYLRHGP